MVQKTESNPEDQVRNAAAAVIRSVSTYDAVQQKLAETRRSLPLLERDLDQARRSAGVKVADGQAPEEAIAEIESARRRIEAATAALASLEEQLKVAESGVRTAMGAYYLAKGAVAHNKLEAHLRIWTAACQALSKAVAVRIEPSDLVAFWPAEARLLADEISCSKMAAGVAGRDSFGSVLASARACANALQQHAA